MKKILTLICGLIITGLFFGFTMADTGWEGATRIERGSYVQTRSVTVSSFTATELIPASFSRPDSICKNVSSYTIYLGSAAAGVTLTAIGLPLGASEYFKLDGSMTGSLYGLAGAGSASGEVKFICLDGLVR